MARTHFIPTDPAPADASNIVVLRPGFALPAVTEPAARTPKRRAARRPKPLLTRATKPADLLTTATEQTGKNPSKSNDLLTAMGRIQVKEKQGTSQLGESPTPSANDPTFKKLVARLPLTKLRETFPVEADAHKNLCGRAKSGKYSVDRRWTGRGAVRTFVSDMGPCPEGYSLDRKNPHDPLYGPGRCRWADKRTQSNNRRNTLKLTAMGQTRPVADWGRITNQNPRTIAKRYTSLGWTMEEAVRGYREGGRRKPDLDTAPALPIAVQPAADVWPPGATADHWEPGFVAWRSQFPGPAVPGLTRAVFLAWIGGNKLRIAYEILTARYPGFNDPEAKEPPAARLDPIHTMILAYEPVVRAALSIVWADPQQNSLLQSLIEQYRRITNPNDAAKLIRKDEY